MKEILYITEEGWKNYEDYRNHLSKKMEQHIEEDIKNNGPLTRSGIIINKEQV